MFTEATDVQSWLKRHSKLTNRPSVSTVVPNSYDLSNTDIPTVEDLTEDFQPKYLYYRDHVNEESEERLEFIRELTTADQRQTFTVSPSRSGLVLAMPPEGNRPGDEFRISAGAATSLRFKAKEGQRLFGIRIVSGDRTRELNYDYDDFVQPESGDGARYVACYDYNFLRAFLRTFDYARDCIRYRSSAT